MKRSRVKLEGSMNIIIVGCGKIGENLAEQLNEPGNNITVVDLSPERVREVAERCDVMGVVGNGATHATQLEAGIADADLLIAVTGSDELNLLCCLLAKKTGNCRTIARVESPEYNTETEYLKKELDLAMIINSKRAAAEEILRVLRFPSAMKIDTFAGGRVELVKFRLPEQSPLVGMSVREVVSALRCDVLICTVEREDEAYIAKGDFVFAGKDVISLIASPKKAADFFKKIEYRTHSVKNALIAGGGQITRYLCEMLEEDGISSTVIERKAEVCQELTARYPYISVIHADAGDQETLLEEGVERAGAFVALTNYDEENILLSLLAKRLTKDKGKLVTKINRFDFSDVVAHLDLDTIIYPKNVASDVIVRYVRAMKNTIGSNVETLYNIIMDKIEASEFIVKEGAPVIGVPLCDLELREDMLIASILRGKDVIIPRGHDRIETGDRVVIVSRMALHDIGDVLR